MYDMQKNCSDGEFAFQARVLTIFSQQNLVTFLAIKKKKILANLLVLWTYSKLSIYIQRSA